MLHSIFIVLLTLHCSCSVTVATASPTKSKSYTFRSDLTPTVNFDTDQQTVPFPDTDRECPSLLPYHLPLELPVRTTAAPAAPTVRLDGGALINVELSRYLAAIQIDRPDDTGRQTCVGTFIKNDTIVTSAECLMSWFNPEVISADEINVYPGATVVPPLFPETSKRAVVSYQVHPLYSTSVHDIANIAILKLEPLTDANDMHAPKVMKSYNKKYFSRTSGIIMRTVGFLNGRIARELHQVDLPITDRERCSDAFKIPVFNLDVHLCLGYGRRSCGPCYDFYGGDTGSPLFSYDEEGIPVLFAIFNRRYCNDDKGVGPAIYLRVRPFFGNFIPTEGLQLTNSTQLLVIDKSLLATREPFPEWAIVVIILGSVFSLAVLGLLIVRRLRRKRKFKNAPSNMFSKRSRAENVEPGVNVVSPEAVIGPVVPPVDSPSFPRITDSDVDPEVELGPVIQEPAPQEVLITPSSDNRNSGTPQNPVDSDTIGGQARLSEDEIRPGRA